jgi:hypothetical protein
MIPAFRPASITDSPEARAHRLGDLLTNFLDKVSILFSTLVLEGLDTYFGGANFEVLELLERVFIPVILHSLCAQGDFPIVQGRLLDEEGDEFQYWAKDLADLQTHLNLDEILVQGLKGECKAWRTSLIFIKVAAVKKGKEIDSNANAMLAAVRNSSGLRLRRHRRAQGGELLQTRRQGSHEWPDPALAIRARYTRAQKRARSRSHVYRRGGWV